MLHRKQSVRLSCLVELERLAQNNEVTIYLASKPLKDMPAERIDGSKILTQHFLVTIGTIELYIRALTGKRMIFLANTRALFQPFPKRHLYHGFALKFPSFQNRPMETDNLDV